MTIHAVKCTLVSRQWLAILRAKPIMIWDVLGDLICDSLRRDGGGTCYLGLDYDDGKGTRRSPLMTTEANTTTQRCFKVPGPLKARPLAIMSCGDICQVLGRGLEEASGHSPATFFIPKAGQVDPDYDDNTRG